MTQRKPSWFRRTERLLYDHKYKESAIAALEAEREEMAASDDLLPNCSASIILGTGKSGHSSPTETWGIKRAEKVAQINRKILEKRRLRDCIRRAREQLTEEENQFVWLRYDKEKPHREIWEALHMSRSTYFNFRKAVIAKTARYIGLC